MDWIDLRSDTVTEPTPEMRRAMAQAEVGDDVYGEDPSINRLQEIAAEKTGKQAALFIPSGTMGNLAAVLATCARGEEVILGDLSHTFLYEAGGISALGGVHPHTVPNARDGTMLLDQIKAAIRPDDSHFPVTRLITLENTHNRRGGAVLPLEYMQAVSALARERGLAVHLDGARLFNAAAALGVPASEIAEQVDSVTFCLSKALCAPVGSLLCGESEFIQRAHRVRKQLGGGMRQAGILAAAGIVALESMADRLAEDHARARRLAEGLAGIRGLTVDPDPPPSNMVYLSFSADVESQAANLADTMRREGIKISGVWDLRLRLVLHYWIDDAGVDATIAAMRNAFA